MNLTIRFDDGVLYIINDQQQYWLVSSMIQIRFDFLTLFSLKF